MQLCTPDFYIRLVNEIAVRNHMTFEIINMSNTNEHLYAHIGKRTVTGLAR